MVPLAGVTFGDPQGGHTSATERVRGVERLACRGAGEAPAGAGTEVARALRHERDVSLEHMPGREQPGVHIDRLEVAAEGLPDRHHTPEPTGFPQTGDQLRERSRQSPTIGHHVRNLDLRSRLSQPRQNCRDGGVQIRGDHRHPLQIIGIAKSLVVPTLLLVDAENHRLQRRVAGLDDVPAGGLWNRGQSVGDGDDHRHAARPETAVDRVGVHQHPVADDRFSDEVCVGQRCDLHLGLAEGNGYPSSARPAVVQGRHDTLSPRDHASYTSASRWDSVGPMSAPTPAAKTERLLNLVICLLYTRQPLSKQRIRQAVPQYGSAASDEAFDRMFERDKEELRDLGIPLRAEIIDPLFDDETGYRIDRREYALPEIHFEPDELAVLGLASRTWQQASLAGPAASALRKLEAADVVRDEGTLVGLEPRVRTAEPAFPAMKDAALARREVGFDYRKPDGSVGRRRLQPWSVTNWHGRWYVAGHDLDRGAPRVFRLGRIEGPVQPTGKNGAYEVPTDHEPLDMIQGSEVEREPQPAILHVRQDRGHALRRRARTAGAVDEEWTQIDIDYTDTEIFAEQIAGYGPAVRVVQPVELRHAVVRRLRASLQRNDIHGFPAAEGMADGR